MIGRLATFGRVLVALVLLVGASCAPREVPTEFPPASAASPAAKQAPVAEVNRWRTSDAPVDEAVYVCPMHSEVRRPSGGACPRCGMTLEKRAPK